MTRPSRHVLLALLLVAAMAPVLPAQPPATPQQPAIAEGPAITVLTGLTVPQFETEMRHFVQSLGFGCGGCHTRGSFASEDNPRKARAREMIEMTRRLNQRYFTGFTPPDGESTLGRVTCFTCHQGETTPKSGPAPPAAR
jgi:cytochrome c553